MTADTGAVYTKCSECKTANVTTQVNVTKCVREARATGGQLVKRAGLLVVSTHEVVQQRAVARVGIAVVALGVCLGLLPRSLSAGDPQPESSSSQIGKWTHCCPVTANALKPVINAPNQSS